MAVSALFIILAVFYVLLMALYAHGWSITAEYRPTPLENFIKVTVIIPARNEEKNIEKCLNSILLQNYPKEYLEIIVADDHSGDRTAEIVRDVAKNNLSVKLLDLQKNREGRYKKAAITAAVSVAKGELIITTDADCEMGSNWVYSIVWFYKTHNALLISGPVAFKTGNYTAKEKFYIDLQDLEFTGLVGIGAASLKLGQPNMCNGANMAYKKSVFDAVGGYAGNDGIPSGDDEFLMHKVFNKYPENVFFLKNKEATVYTRPAETLDEFREQRTRWVSKSTKYADKKITLILSLAYLFNLSIVLSLLFVLFDSDFFLIFLLQIAAKIAVEYAFYTKILKFFGKENLAVKIPLAQPFHIAYVLLIGILGNFAEYNWKGRKI